MECKLEESRDSACFALRCVNGTWHKVSIQKVLSGIKRSSQEVLLEGKFPPLLPELGAPRLPPVRAGVAIKYWDSGIWAGPGPLLTAPGQQN